MNPSLKPISFGLVDQLANGSALQCVEGRIVKVYNQRVSPPESSRAWSCQDIVLKDAAAEMKVTLWNHDEIPRRLENTKIRFEQTIHGKTQKAQGIEIEDNEYQGKTTRRIKVTGSALVIFDPDKAAPSNPPADAPPAQKSAAAQNEPPPRSAAQNAPASRHTAAGGEDAAAAAWSAARKFAARSAALYAVSYDAAVAAAWNVFDRHGYAMVPTAVGILADKFWMEAMRKLGLDQVHALPLAPTMKEPARPLSDFIVELNRQVAATRAASAASANHPPAGAPAPQPDPGFFDDTGDQIPF